MLPLRFSAGFPTAMLFAGRDGRRMFAAFISGWTAVALLASCGGGGGASTPPPPTYALGGTVSGLLVNGLVLSNGGALLTVNAGATSFSFGSILNPGSSYAVTLQTVPSGLTCSIANSAGVAGTANVNNVVVTCSDKSYALGGIVSGLNATGLVLVNGADSLAVSAGATRFSMPAQVAFGSSYSVVVGAQPTGASCSISNGSGTMPAGNVNGIVVACSDQPYTLGGTVSGLNGSGLVLANGSDSLSIAANATSFTMPSAVAYASSYAVTVAVQPTGLTCSVSNGAGTMPAANVNSVSVTCSDKSYSLGGTVSGLNGTGLVLANGTDSVVVPLNATSFTLPTLVAYGSAYAVTIATQPTGLTCSVSSGSGTMPAANVVNVAVTCADRSYTLGGVITGLTASGLILSDGIDTLTVAANAAQFSMPTGVAYTSYYTVTVNIQPAGLNCTVGNGSGTMPAANVSSVQVNCELDWIWESGVTTPESIGVYGAKGVAASTNVPGARFAAVSWTDTSGNLWMFGGNGYNATSTPNLLNDLWTYNVSTNQWTWVSGFDTPNLIGIYGIQGVEAPSNVPGPRSDSVSWNDGGGGFWLFGGIGYDSAGTYGPLNDLWRFRTSTNQWTWVSGSNVVGAMGVYGVQGVPASTNVPGARIDALAWTDSGGNLWLFGGNGNSSINSAYLNDLWKFSPTTGQWSWMSGSATADAVTVYGTQGLGSPANGPGARQNSISWVDATGDLWLFGGVGIDAYGAFGVFNDLWMYSPSTGEWTWVGGSNLDGQSSVYGIQGSASASNVPGARNSSISWNDGAGGFWLFGGYGFPTSGGGGDINDLWRYTPTDGQWTWVGGSNAIGANGVYGTKSSAAATNIPGARTGAVSWTDRSGHLWLFGGNGYDATGMPGRLNDLWKH
jgi:N-acetylneuraminic acid mutarotase